jgi:hypothetical protein
VIIVLGRLSIKRQRSLWAGTFDVPALVGVGMLPTATVLALSRKLAPQTPWFAVSVSKVVVVA